MHLSSCAHVLGSIVFCCGPLLTNFTHTCQDYFTCHGQYHHCYDIFVSPVTPILLHITFHQSIHPYPFKIKVLPVPHSMGLAARGCRTPALHASLSSESKPGRPHLSIAVFTHSEHVFWGLPLFLVPGKFGIDLTQDVTRCTWPYHLSRRQRRTDMMPSLSNFCSCEAEGVSSLSLMPQIQQIMAPRSLRRNCRSSWSFVPTFRYHGA